jgi:hypothetical protein
MNAGNRTRLDRDASAASNRVTVTMDRLARLVFTHYLFLSFVSFVFLCLIKRYAGQKPELIEISFYPLFLVVGLLIRRFLSEIPETFLSLQANGALAEESAKVFIQPFEKRLNSWAADTSGIVLGLACVWFYQRQLLDAATVAFSRDPLWIKLGYVLSSLAVCAIDVLLAYAGRRSYLEGRHHRLASSANRAQRWPADKPISSRPIWRFGRYRRIALVAFAYSHCSRFLLKRLDSVRPFYCL